MHMHPDIQEGKEVKTVFLYFFKLPTKQEHIA